MINNPGLFGSLLDRRRVRFARFRSLTGRAITVMIFSVSLASCGRKGALEAPPGSLAHASSKAERSQANTSNLEGAARSPGSAVTPPKKRFFLDPIL